MHYSSLETYLREAELTLASPLPIPFVARWMGVTPPAVKSMLTRGVLQAVSIGSTQFVSAASLRAWQAELEAEVKRTRKLLLKAARKDRPLAYSDLLAKLGRAYTNPADRRRLGRILAAVSDRSLAEDGSLLAVWAFSKATGLPKYGVWELAEEQGWWSPAQDRSEFVMRLREASQPTAE